MHVPRGSPGGSREELEAEVQALRILIAATRDENTTLSQANAALRAEVHRLTVAVDASNTELRRVLGVDPAVMRAETAWMIQERDTAQAEVRAVTAELAAAQQQLLAARERLQYLDHDYVPEAEPGASAHPASTPGPRAARPAAAGWPTRT